MSLVAASSVGKWPRVLMILRTPGGNAKNGITRSQALRHAPLTVGNFGPQGPVANASSSAWAASALGAEHRERSARYNFVATGYRITTLVDVAAAIDTSLVEMGYGLSAFRHKEVHELLQCSIRAETLVLRAPEPSFTKRYED